MKYLKYSTVGFITPLFFAYTFFLLVGTTPPYDYDKQGKGLLIMFMIGFMFCGAFFAFITDCTTVQPKKLSLDEQLRNAIRNEDYETASKIRDQMNNL